MICNKEPHRIQDYSVLNSTHVPDRWKVEEELFLYSYCRASFHVQLGAQEQKTDCDSLSQSIEPDTKPNIVGTY